MAVKKKVKKVSGPSYTFSVTSDDQAAKMEARLKEHIEKRLQEVDRILSKWMDGETAKNDEHRKFQIESADEHHKILEGYLAGFNKILGEKL